MICPQCNAKIRTADYDEDYGWYECPKCEGCFTPDEIEEAHTGTSPGKRRKEAEQAKKNGKPEGKVVIAKAKKKKAEIEEDEEVIAAHEAEMLKPVKTDEPVVTKHKDDVLTKEVVNIWADEISTIYEELGGSIDDVNARDKALILWRQVRIDTGISAREQEVEYVSCANHG